MASQGKVPGMYVKLPSGAVATIHACSCGNLVVYLEDKGAALCFMCGEPMKAVARVKKNVSAPPRPSLRALEGGSA